MQKDLVFFKKEGEEGVALTSTSANHIANMAKEYIHPDGVLSDERKKLKDRIQHPHQVDGKGRDALIYTYEPSVSAEDVDNTFYELQKKHREVQAQLNSMKHDCEVAIEESTNKSNTGYAVASSEYREALKAIMLSFKTWKDAKSQEYSKLKIAVPDSLLGVYNKESWMSSHLKMLQKPLKVAKRMVV